MGFPQDELTSNESVVMHLHPHWKALVGPIGVLVLVVAAVVADWVGNYGGSVVLLIVGVIGLVLVGWLTVWPYMRWHSTHYVFTNERVLTRLGVFGHDLETIPLNRVNDFSYHQSFFDRIFGCGSLTIESAGDHGQDVFKEIPHVSKVLRTLHELIDPDDNNKVVKQAGSNDGSTQQLNSNN